VTERAGELEQSVFLKKLKVTVPVAAKPGGTVLGVAESPTELPRGVEVPVIPTRVVPTVEVPIETVNGSHELRVEPPELRLPL
jgi:hypothetical protein